MKTIVLASQKGGSGKTILAAHLAVAAEIAGDGPCVLMLALWKAGMEWSIKAAMTTNSSPTAPPVPTPTPSPAEPA
jgi:chromosome partitioning protein